MQRICGLLQAVLVLSGSLLVHGAALVLPRWLLQAEIKEGLPALQREPGLKMGV